MGGFQILLIIYGLLIFLYGYYIYKSKHPYIPRLRGKATKKYYKYVGKTTMLISISPIMTALISSVDGSAFTFFFSIFIFIFLIVLAFVISNKYYRRWMIAYER